MTLAAELLSVPERLLWPLYSAAREAPVPVLLLVFIATIAAAFGLVNRIPST
jgi:hypothetical protein